MSTAHTPGPWKVFEHSWCNTSIVADGFDHGICGLDINHATEKSQVADEALMAANARLIAAAPDLLALLSEAVDLQRKHYGYGISLHVEMASWADKASAAIAKATGFSDA